VQTKPNLTLVTAAGNDFVLWDEFPHKNGYWTEGSSLLKYDALSLDVSFVMF
jgi:hypothetical protein